MQPLYSALGVHQSDCPTSRRGHPRPRPSEAETRRPRRPAGRRRPDPACPCRDSRTWVPTRNGPRCGTRSRACRPVRSNSSSASVGTGQRQGQRPQVEGIGTWVLVRRRPHPEQTGRRQLDLDAQIARAATSSIAANTRPSATVGPAVDRVSVDDGEQRGECRTRPAADQPWGSDPALGRCRQDAGPLRHIDHAVARRRLDQRELNSASSESARSPRSRPQCSTAGRPAPRVSRTTLTPPARRWVSEPEYVAGISTPVLLGEPAHSCSGGSNRSKPRRSTPVKRSVQIVTFAHRVTVTLSRRLLRLLSE